MPQKNNIELSIITPSYNEINVIEEFVFKLKKTFVGESVKFIFVNDGSSDGTKEWLNKNIPIIFKSNKYEILNLDKNVGKGGALRQSFLHAEGNYILLIDSDMEYNPLDALEMYNLIKSNHTIEVLFGSRYLGGKIQHRIHFFNDLAVRINTFIFNFFFAQSITDLHSGTKIFSKTILNKLDLSINDFGFEIDISAQIAKNNYKIYEYGISYLGRTKAEGKKITLYDGLLSYYYLFKTRFIQNDLPTLVSLFYSTLFMGYIGTHFGLGIGKTMVIIFFAIIGMLMGINRKIIPLTIIFGFVYVGSLFSKGNGRIYTVLIFFLLSLYVSKLIKKNFKSKSNKFFLNYFI